MKVICWLKGILRTLSRPGVWLDGIPIDGCDYVDIEEHKNCTVTISKCEHCGKIEIDWC